MSRKHLFAIGALVLGGLIWFLGRGGSPEQPAADVRTASSPATLGPAPAGAPSGDARPQAPARREQGAPVQDRAAPEEAKAPPDTAERPALAQPQRTGPSMAQLQREHLERDQPAGGNRSPEQKGGVQREAIRDAIKAALPEVRDCYEQALKQDPSLAGKVIVEFELETKDQQGTVMRGEVIGTETKSPFFEACVLQKVAGTKFPAPEGGGTVTVRYPFHFDPGGGFCGEETP